MQVFRAFTNRSFALLWGGQTLSRLGDSLFMIALAWWVLQKTGSAAAMGLVLICTTLPMLICLLFGGVIVDRLPRRSLMLASDLVNGVAVLVIAFLAFQQQLELWHVCVLGVLFGIVEAFFSPAYTAIIPDLVKADLLPSANSLTSISLDAMQFIGPAIAAVIITLGRNSGTALAFALDSVSFLISASMIAALPRLEALREPGEKEEGILHDVRKGLLTVKQSPWLWITLVVASVSTLFLVAPSEAVLPLLVKQRFGTQVGFYALLTALSALGSIVAAFIMGHFERLRYRGWLTYGAWIIACVMLVLMGLPIGIVGVSIAIFIQGAAIVTLGLAWMNSLQEFIPEDLLGRVSSIDILVSSGFLPIGYGLAGILADRLGAPLVFILGGAIAAFIIILGILHPAIRKVD